MMQNRLLNSAFTAALMVCLIFPSGEGGPNKLGRLLGYSQPNADFTPHRIEYHLYSRDNINNAVKMRKRHPLRSGFNVGKRTVVLVHGTTGSAEMPTMVHLKDTILKEHNVNVIIFNWEYYARTLKDVMKYYKPIGRTLGGFLTNLHNKTGYEYQKIHIIGHSVGVHVSAYAGRSTPQKIHRITGLDPSFLRHVMQNRTDFILPTDATHVDCIHTSTYLGVRNPVCQCDFYANEGVAQIGCPTGICNHFASVAYYNNTIINPRKYPAHLCEKVTAKFVEGCAEAYTAYAGQLGAISCKISGVYQFRAVVTKKQAKDIADDGKVISKQFVGHVVSDPKESEKLANENATMNGNGNGFLNFSQNLSSHPSIATSLKALKGPISAVLAKL